MNTTARTLAILATVLLVMGACAAAPSPSPSIEPTPSPTPVDPAEAFLAIMGAPGWAGHADIVGTVTVAGIEGTVSGTQDVIGLEMQLSLTVEIAEVASRQRTVSIGEDTYTSVDGGPWYWTVDEGEHQTLVDAVSGALVESATETLDGVVVHRLEARDADFEPSFFGLDADLVSGLRVEATFLVRDDGTPVAFEFEVKWAQVTPAGDVANEMALRWELSAPVVDEIVAPSPTWVRFASDRFPYVIGYPKSWEAHVDEAEGYEYFQGQRRWVEVVHYGGVTATAAEWFSESRDILLNDFGGLDGEEPITVSGTDAYLFSAHVTIAEAPYFFMQATFVHGGGGWDVNWYSRPGTEDEDVLQFLEILDTFAATDAAPAPPVSTANVWDLELGSCFDSLPLFAGPGLTALFVGGVDGFSAVDCAADHTGEVIAVVLAGQEVDCRAVFAEYVGGALEESDYGLLTMVPVTADNAPEIDSLCVVAHGSGSSRGSAAGTGG